MSTNNADVKITADQFLAQCDKTLGEAVNENDAHGRVLVLRLRECFVGAYYVLKTHETTISHLHDELKRTRAYLGEVVATHGLAPMGVAKDKARTAGTMVASGRGGDGEGGGKRA